MFQAVTSNLKRHLSRYHQNIYKKVQKADKNNDELKNKTKLSKLQKINRDEVDQSSYDKNEYNQPETIFVNTITTLESEAQRTSMSKTHVSNNKMDKICRLCAKRSSSLTSLFSFKNQRLIIDLIITICPIRIDRNDEFPKKICDECLEIIVSANELRSTSVKSDSDFRLGSISLMNNEDIEETSVTDFVHVKIEKTDDWFACSPQVYSAEQSDDEYERRPRKINSLQNEENFMFEYSSESEKEAEWEVRQPSTSFRDDTSQKALSRNLMIKYFEPPIKDGSRQCKLCDQNTRLVSSILRYL